jgi:hypothetical protein
MEYWVPATTKAGVAKLTDTNAALAGTLEAGTLLLARTATPGTPPLTSRISTFKGAVGVVPVCSLRFRSTWSSPPLRPAVKVWARLWVEFMKRSKPPMLVCC